MSALPRAVFFDRDGILNVDSGYVHRKEDVQWIPGAVDIISELTQKGWLIFVVTNQSGVARGYYSEKEVHALHQWMNYIFSEKNGHVTEFFYCPHLSGADVKKYDTICSCRKPKPGMIFQALEKYQVPKERAFLFGDGKRDIEAASRAGIQGFLFDGSNIRDFVREKLPQIKD